MVENQDAEHAAKAPAVLPILSRIIDRDKKTKKVILCHPCVRYVGKIKGEGNNFCGYRNIQMLVGYVQDCGIGMGMGGGLEGGIPGVLELQDMIEDAWMRGFNEYGRKQTGGIRDTRKHIGTPEVSTFLRT